MTEDEIKLREQAAIKAIHSVYGTAEDEYGATMFVSHHLEEIEAEYWVKHLNTSKPEPKQIIGLLCLRGHWDDDAVFDFTLPDEVTNYVISVSFGEDGNVEEVTMES